MQTQASNAPGGTDTRPSPMARTLAFQGAANRIVRGLLRTPLLCRLIGRRLVTLYVVGRSTGRHYTIPVAYTRHDGALLVGTPFGWGRNLRTGEPVAIRFMGARRMADVEVIADEPGVINAYRMMAADNHRFASFNRISLDANGTPDPADLQQAWAAGARAVRLTPH